MKQVSKYEVWSFNPFNLFWNCQKYKACLRALVLWAIHPYCLGYRFSKFHSFCWWFLRLGKVPILTILTIPASMVMLRADTTMVTSQVQCAEDVRWIKLVNGQMLPFQRSHWLILISDSDILFWLRSLWIWNGSLLTCMMDILFYLTLSTVY